MTMPLQATEKPKLSKSILKAHDVFFYEDVCTGDKLPEWIQPTQARLLHMRSRITAKEHKTFEKERTEFEKSNCGRGKFWQGWSFSPGDVDPQSLYFQDESSASKIQKKSLLAELEQCENIRVKAEEYEENNEVEKIWERLLAEDIFSRFGPKNGYTDVHAKALRGWQVAHDVLWGEFYDRAITKHPLRRTIPKPDFTYGFPIVDTSETGMERYTLDPNIFSLQQLHELRNRKDDPLVSAPTNALRRLTSGNAEEMRPSHLMCFPWAVVEVKPNLINSKKSRWVGRPETFSYCQAANASAAALTLREALKRQAGDCSKFTGDLAIIAFTCVGPDVKLWLTYREESGQVAMRCIWASSLQLRWGVFQLRMIVQNMHEWIREVVRPKILHWVGLVRQPPTVLHFFTPDNDPATSTRRARSCTPAKSRPVMTLTPDQTPRPPKLPRGKTAPEPIYPTSGDSFRIKKYERYDVEDSEDSENNEDLDQKWDVYYSEDQVEPGELRDLLKTAPRWHPQEIKRHVDDASQTSDEEVSVEESDGEDDYTDKERRPSSRQLPTTPRAKAPTRRCVSAKKENTLKVDQSPTAKTRRRSMKI